jgi:hypothetical protein
MNDQDLPDSHPITRELFEMEPLFHNPEFSSTRKALEIQASPGFWEVGASGFSYGRERIIDTVEKRFQDGTEKDTSAWTKDEFTCRELGPDTYLATYVLNQNGRLTKRATIWRKENGKWRAMYHQGTIAAK